jgi:RsmE family RNA methyltransferase
MNIILFDDIPKFISLTDPRGRHLKKVLKVRTGDSFRAGLINGPLGEVRVLGFRSGELRSGAAAEAEGYELEWRETGPAPPPAPLSLIVGFVRPISAKRILREAASLGVGRLIFTVTDTGERSYREAKLWKGTEWREYLINGLQTAGATVLPELLLTGGVEEAVRLAGEIQSKEERVGGRGAERPASESPAVSERSSVSSVSSGAKSLLMLDNVSGGPSLTGRDLRGRELVLAVGSERGWTDRERRVFLEAGYEASGLGRRVLRTETACSVGAALALAGMGFLA